jgi:hypothetical protein
MVRRGESMCQFFSSVFLERLASALSFAERQQVLTDRLGRKLKFSASYVDDDKEVSDGEV